MTQLDQNEKVVYELKIGYVENFVLKVHCLTQYAY